MPKCATKRSCVSVGTQSCLCRTVPSNGQHAPVPRHFNSCIIPNCEITSYLILQCLFLFRITTISMQVLILNETTESRMIKLVLPLTEACLSMELISCFNDQNKHRQNALVLLLKSGCLCLVDDFQIERYLIQCQSKSPPTLPNQILVKLPFGDSPITVAKLYTSNTAPLSFMDEVCISLSTLNFIKLKTLISSLLKLYNFFLCVG